MIKADNFTRAEICAFLKHSLPREDDEYPRNFTLKEWQKEIIEYLIEEFSDPDLSLDTETGFFVYTGPELPKIPVNRK